MMTAPNGPGAQPQPPYNPQPPGSGSSVPRSVLIGGAGAVLAIVVVVILVISLSGEGGDEDGNTRPGGAELNASTSAEADAFVPNLGHASFGGGWQNKKTQEPTIPPQHITITGSVDLTKEVEAVGYGPIEQSMPKIAKYAATDSSFPRSPAIDILPAADGDLHLSWGCETMSKKPAGTDCHSYNMTIDISGPTPVVVDAAPVAVGPIKDSSVALEVDVQKMAVSNPEELPASPLSTDKATGATTVLMLSAVQPRESTAKVYFLVPDSLKLYVGELESSR